LNTTQMFDDEALGQAYYDALGQSLHQVLDFHEQVVVPVANRRAEADDQ
jgi:hypothetical protein